MTNDVIGVCFAFVTDMQGPPYSTVISLGPAQQTDLESDAVARIVAPGNRCTV